MDDLQPMGRILIVVGIALLAAGVLLAFGPRIPFLGNLPGDIRIERDNVKVFIPLGTMIVLSIVLSLVLTALGRSR